MVVRIIDKVMELPLKDLLPCYVLSRTRYQIYQVNPSKEFR
jgi:hypothetical protein